MKFLICFMLAMLSFSCFAQDLPGDTAPAWLMELLLFVAAVPKVGPVLVEIAKWIGVVASVFTVLSVAVTAVLKIPELAAKWSGAQKLSEDIAKLNAKIQPYLKYLSIFNVKK